MGIVIESQTFIGVATGATGARAEVWLPPGFTLTGGGAYHAAAGLAPDLTACCPIRNEEGQYTGWAVAGRSAVGDAAPLAVYAVGIRIVMDGVPLKVDQQVFCATSALVADPGVTVRLGLGWIGTGGGAQDNHASALNAGMVTSHYPLLSAEGQINGWSASARAHDGECDAPVRVTAYVVGIKTVPQVALDPKILSSCLRPSFPATACGNGGLRIAGQGSWFAAARGEAANAMLEAA